MTPEFITSTGLRTAHGFFTRRGGVSEGPYASLNASLSGGDDPAHVAANRALMAETLHVAPDRLLGVTQVHGVAVATVRQPWASGAGPIADAMVTDCPGLALGVITADCAPVLLFHAGSAQGKAQGSASVIGAVHAGWRGAASGVLEAAIAAMEAVGASRARMVAAIGPCIAQASYEVGEELFAAVTATGPLARTFFAPGARPAHWQFDLPGYCLARLHAAGVRARWLGADTCADETRFFSHRRRTLAGGGPIGHQLSAIVLHQAPRPRRDQA